MAYILDAHTCQEPLHLLLYQGRDLLLSGEGYFWSAAQLEAFHGNGASIRHLMPLQRSENRLYAAVALGRAEKGTASLTRVSTRDVLLQEGFDRFALVGRGSQLAHWYDTHRFCGACGAATVPRGAQRVLGCDQCAVDYYPRINPCIIVLVTHGRNVLLARHARRGGGMHSCLAGFIEPGETPEQAVHREVGEEAGIAVKNLRYFSSQPWPFPSQLMLGYFADYAGGEIELVDGELESAGWFDIDDLPQTPQARFSVAGQLIEAYRKEIAMSSEQCE